MIFMMVRERLMNLPFLVVTDDKVVMNSGKAWEIPFCDVESFSLFGGKSKFISIHYKENVEVKKMEDASWMGRLVREMNRGLSGSQEHLPADGLTMKPKQLHHLLNERLLAFNEGRKG